MATVRWRPGMFGWHRDPFTEIEDLQRQMNRLFTASGDRPTAVFRTGVFPALNLSQDADNLYVRAELPGVSAQDLEIATQDDNLIIKGERKNTAEGDAVSYHRREREAGTFQRIISLPARVDADEITAICKKGVLTVTLPKAAGAKLRRIEVNAA